MRCQMVGHDLDHVNEFYASEFTVDELALEVFPKFVFTGLNVLGLTYQAGEFNDAIKVGYVKALDDERRRKVQKEREQRAEGA